MNDIVFLPAHQLAKTIRDRQVSSIEIVNAYLDQIARFNPAIHAVVTLDEQGAQQRARAADEALAHGELWGPLHGVPITLEDAHPTSGLRTTWGGYPPMAGYIPSYDSPVVSRLKAAGAIVLGKTNGPVIWGDQSIFELTRNPWDLDRTPGTSSAGPAAALAAGLTPLDIGLDTLASILYPAHCCGVFGMRPTEHRVPLTDVFYLDGDSRKWRIMSVAGPMARSVEDLRLALSIIAGTDRRDTHVPPLPWLEAPRPDLRNLKIAWAATFPGMPILPSISASIENLVSQLAHLGCHVEQRLPDVNYLEQGRLGEQLFELLAPALATRPDGAPIPTIDAYLELLNQRDRFIVAWEQFFSGWDIFLCPSGPFTAERRSEKGLEVVGLEVASDQLELCNIPFFISPVSGCPSVVMPLGRDMDGMPFGVQLLGRRWGDERLLAIAEVISEVIGGFQPPPGY